MARTDRMEVFNISSIPPRKLTISAIIPVHNGGENFRRSLLSLTKTSPHPNEIIVVADGDTDGSWHVAEEFGVKILRLPARGGPAHARNLGAHEAQGDILFFMDADVAIPPNTIEQITSTFNLNPGLAALFGSYDNEPEAKNFLSQYKNLFHHYIHQRACNEASTFWGACGAIRHDVFMSIGGFDEHYRQPSIEDIELGYRLKQAGHKIWLCKDLQVKHLKCWRVFSLIKSDFFHRALPWTDLILRDRYFINDLNLRFSSRMSAILTYALIGALIGARWWYGAIAVASVLALLLLIINQPVYQFFLQKRGFWFMMGTIPWHWFYFFYSGLGFVVGVSRFLFSSRKSQKLSLPGITRRRSDTIPYPEGD